MHTENKAKRQNHVTEPQGYVTTDSHHYHLKERKRAGTPLS